MTNFVVGDNISLFRLSSKTKFVVDNKVCRRRQSLSLATMLVVGDNVSRFRWTQVMAAMRLKSASGKREVSGDGMGISSLERLQ